MAIYLKKFLKDHYSSLEETFRNAVQSKIIGIFLKSQNKKVQMLLMDSIKWIIYVDYPNSSLYQQLMDSLTVDLVQNQTRENKTLII